MFSTRKEAGKKLAKRLLEKQIQADLVLGIPRGGVVVAAEIARNLELPLDVLVIKKLTAPNNPELAIGAIAPGTITYIDDDMVRSTNASAEYLRDEVKRRHHELLERERLLRFGKPPLDVSKKKVILVDDGAATGATLFASLDWLVAQKTGVKILALPVASRFTIESLKTKVDICEVIETPDDFRSVGQFYEEFHQVSESDIVTLLNSLAK